MNSFSSSPPISRARARILGMEEVHKAFVQWMLVERVVREDDFKRAISQIKNNPQGCDQQQMFDFVLPIQQSLRRYDMDLMRMYFAASDQYLWIVANLNSDTIAQLATTYSANEVAAFKRIVKLLSEANQHQMSQLELAVRIRDHAEASLSASKAEAIIEDFLNDFWLFKSEKSGKVSLGPKAVGELKQYLVEEELFNECKFCKTIIVIGKTIQCMKCEEMDIKSFYHERCTPLATTCKECKTEL